MGLEKPSPLDYNRPVAYDADGRPLYAHPPSMQPIDDNQPQVVRVVQPVDIRNDSISSASSKLKQKIKLKQEIKQELKQELKHDRSKKKFPEIELREGEYIISAIQRHPIGLIGPLTLGVTLVTMALILMINYDFLFRLAGRDVADPFVVIFPAILFIVFVIFGTYAAYYIYVNNKLFLTNKIVVQEIQIGLFSKREQTVNLMNVEDVSYTQNGLAQQIFNYGSVRLTTEGNGTTYRFAYVSNPKKCTKILNNAVESAREKYSNNVDN